MYLCLTAQGSDFVVRDYLYGMSALAAPPPSANNVMRVDKFSIDYRPDGQVAQVG